MVLCSRCKKNEAIPDRKWCLRCASYMQGARRRHRCKAKPSGACSRTDCTNPATGKYRMCDRCRAKIREYEKKNRSRVQFHARQTRRRCRMRVFDVYGGAKCACCGEDHYEFLTIDHIDGNGAEHRRQLGTKRDIYTWLKKNSFPPGFRVLCMNCNFALGYHGYCPHRGWTQPTSNGRMNRPAKTSN